MLGWDITVIRPREPLLGPDDPRLDRYEFGPVNTSPTLRGDTLASWSARLRGLDWLEPADGEPSPCRQLGGGGYPNVYVVPAEVVLTKVDWDFVRTRYLDRSKAVDLSAVAAVPSDEWLLVEAWDQS